MVDKIGVEYVLFLGSMINDCGFVFVFVQMRGYKCVTSPKSELIGFWFFLQMRDLSEVGINYMCYKLLCSKLMVNFLGFSRSTLSTVHYQLSTIKLSTINCQLSTVNSKSCFSDGKGKPSLSGTRYLSGCKFRW
jgi:hypothetical protein